MRFCYGQNSSFWPKNIFLHLETVTNLRSLQLTRKNWRDIKADEKVMNRTEEVKSEYIEHLQKKLECLVMRRDAKDDFHMALLYFLIFPILKIICVMHTIY